MRAELSEEQRWFERSPGGSDRRFRLLAENAPVMIWTSGVDRSCDWFNRTWLEFRGKALEEELGNGWIAGVHPDDLAPSQSQYVSSFQERRAFRMEYRLRRRDGVYRWILDHGTPLFAPDGSFAGYVGSCIDITESKEVEQRLGLQIAVARTLAEAGTLAEAAPGILEGSCEALGWDSGAIWKVDEPAGVLRCVAFWRAPRPELASFEALTRELAFVPGLGLPGRVWQAREPVWIEDVVRDPNFPRARVARAAGLRGAVGFPMLQGERVLGVIEFFCAEPKNPDTALMSTLSALGHQIGRFLAQKSAEEATRYSEARKSAMLESALDAIITIDGSGRVVEFNSAAQRMFGYDATQAIGKELAELIVPERLRARHRLAIAHHSPERPSAVLGKRLEMPARRADGSEFPVEISIVRVPLEAGTVFTGYLRDLTEQKRAQKDLDRSRRLFQRIAETIPDTLYLYDLHERRLVFVNHQLSDALGHGREELEVLGAPVPGELVHPEDAAALTEFRKRLDETTDGEILELEYRVRHADGSYRWVSDRGVVFDRTPDGGPRQILGLVRDVTPRRRSEEELSRQAAELQRSNKDLEQFAYVASHDLQEPLRMVTVYCQMLQKRYGGKLGEEADEFIGFAVDGARRMEMLLRDLLVYSRITGAGTGEPSTVDCEAVLREVLVTLSTALQESGAVVTHDRLPLVRVQEVHVHQLLQNLIANAIKYRSDEPPAIRVSARREGAQWELAIRDNGIGIEPESREEVFGVFRRLHGNRYAGTGIGLAICARIVERYGGRIWVESKPGGGSTFRLTLPAAEGVE